MQFEKMASIPLRTHEPSVIPPNPIAVLHPASYLPHIPLMALGELLGLSPLVIFYLGRIAGLTAGVALTFLAIRIVPVHKNALASIALLPPVLFSRSTLDADQFTNGLAFLFLALVMREIGAKGRISSVTLAGLSIGGLILAQCKSAYLFLPLLALAIPVERFGSGRSKALAMTVIALPGLLGSVAWMVTLKQTYFQGLRYRTWSGLVLPDQQLNLILSQPLIYGEPVARTVFATPLLPKSVIEFLGVFGPPVMMPTAFYPALAILTGSAILSEERASQSPLHEWRTRALALSLALVTILVILTLLYIQWTRFQAPIVQGFNGRYFYPLAPLLLLFAPSSGIAFLGVPGRCWLILVGLVSLGGTLWVT